MESEGRIVLIVVGAAVVEVAWVLVAQADNANKQIRKIKRNLDLANIFLPI